jgi:hypothetical protein
MALVDSLVTVIPLPGVAGVYCIEAIVEKDYFAWDVLQMCYNSGTNTPRRISMNHPTSAKPLRLLADCAIVLSAAATGVAAFPTGIPLVGSTGLGTMPTTETVPNGEVEVGLAYERVKPDFGRVSFFPDATATYGFKRGEVGAAYVRERDSIFGFSLTSNDFTLHGKYRVYENARNGAAVAAGAHYLHFDDSQGSVTSLYLTGSYPFMAPTEERKASLRGHLGLIYQHVDSGDSGADSANKVRPMVGLEFLTGSAFSIAADYIPNSGDVARTMSLAARYQMTSGFGAQIGVGRLRDDNKYFAGVTYRFRGKR